MIKPLKFVGGSKKDLSSFPEVVKQDVGHALFMAQEGNRSATVKTLQGFGGGSVVVVLHAFQKKSKRGSETPKHEIEMIHTRLRAALNREWN
jgi:phage-related protein